MNYFIKKKNGEKMKYHEFYPTDGFVFKFLDVDYDVVNAFFGNQELPGFEIVDENDIIHDSQNVTVKRRSITVEKIMLTVQNNVLKQEEYEELMTGANEEPVLDEMGNQQYIHHDAIYDVVSSQVPGEMTTVALFPPDINEQMGEVKKKIGMINPDALLLEEYRAYCIAQTKAILATYLEEHPLHSICHGGKEGIYSITEEKRNMFTSKFISHTAKVQAGIGDIMTWNASGEACEPWTDAECMTLICEWDAVTTPLVALQQHLEKQIKDCVLRSDIEGVVIDYAAADIRNQPTVE